MNEKNLIQILTELPMNDFFLFFLEGEQLD